MNFFEVCFNSMVGLYVLLSLFVIWYLNSARKLSIEQFRLKQGRIWLKNLDCKEIYALSQLMICRAITGDQVREKHPDVDFTRIHNVTPFLSLIPPPVDVWSFNEDWYDVLVKIMLLEGNR